MLEEKQGNLTEATGAIDRMLSDLAVLRADLDATAQVLHETRHELLRERTRSQDLGEELAATRSHRNALQDRLDQAHKDLANACRERESEEQARRAAVSYLRLCLPHIEDKALAGNINGSLRVLGDVS